MARKLTLKKKIIFTLVTIILATVAAMIAGEIFLRLFAPEQMPMRWFKSDPVLGYVNKPDFHQDFRYSNTGFVMTVRTNSFGHRRDSEISDTTLNDKKIKKILLIGDSFTFGYGVNIEDHFGTILERRLNRDSSGYIVLNSGVGGWGAMQAFKYAEMNFKKFKPDVIVYTFCGNDPEDDVTFMNDITLTDKEKGLFYFPGKVFLRDHSHLVRFVARKLRILIHNFALKSELGKHKGVKIDEQSATLILKDKWPAFIQRVREFYTEFLKFNPDGIFIIQVSAPWNEEYRDIFSKLDNGGNLRYLDMYNETVDLSEQDRRMPHDAHWSPLIHHIASDKLAEIIDTYYRKQ